MAWKYFVLLRLKLCLFLGSVAQSVTTRNDIVAIY